MSLMTSEPTAANADNDSYNTGLLDGELAAFTKLPARRAHAIASMADQYDPLYAQGYADGYLAGIERNHAYAEKNGSA